LYLAVAPAEQILTVCLRSLHASRKRRVGRKKAARPEEQEQECPVHQRQQGTAPYKVFCSITQFNLYHAQRHDITSQYITPHSPRLTPHLATIHPSSPVQSINKSRSHHLISSHLTSSPHIMKTEAKTTFIKPIARHQPNQSINRTTKNA
jgi:hypothetical protein